MFCSDEYFKGLASLLSQAEMPQEVLDALELIKASLP